MEAALLKSQHEVARLAAQTGVLMRQLAQAPPERAPAGLQAFQQLQHQVAQGLTKEVTQLGMGHKQQVAAVEEGLGDWEELSGRAAALALFQPGAGRNDPLAAQVRGSGDVWVLHA